MEIVGVAIAAAAFATWHVLVGAWGQFWRADRHVTDATIESYPSACAIVPARDEADVLPHTLRSLLTQDYPGTFRVLLVDDRSTDGTAAIARQVAAEVGAVPLEVVGAQQLPAGWTGKLWALEQGWQRARQDLQTELIWLTDADIAHAPQTLRQLAARAETDGCDLVSLMARLRCESFWERWLIPAFVYFFMQLYPFRWVNDPKRDRAAAAGGCILLRRRVLEQLGGLEGVRGELIDDCALAAAVKRSGSRIWLGLTHSTRSLRDYPTLSSIWDLVARTAYTQLDYSPRLLLLALLGLTGVYLVPPLGTVWGIATGSVAIALLSAAAWLLMALSYMPTLALYGRSWLWGFSLPGIALLYGSMTFDSARRHWRGQGGSWKGRTYPQAKSS